MDIFLQQIINGLVLGSIYALIALGYTMVYGILGIINFAHGDVLMVEKKSTATVGDTLDLDEYEKEKIDEDQKLYEVTFPDVAKALERWAKKHYVDAALANATAEVTTELNVQVVPGKRYTVASPNGVIFKGFLYQVQHGLSSVPRSLQAHTKLIFSHIEAEGFELPFKS